jgi:hypothetical protein
MGPLGTAVEPALLADAIFALEWSWAAVAESAN